MKRLSETTTHFFLKTLLLSLACVFQSHFFQNQISASETPNPENSTDSVRSILKPAFPNYATVPTPLKKSSDGGGMEREREGEGRGAASEIKNNSTSASSRLNPVLPADPAIPFGWDQTIVLREQNSTLRQINGFDPDFQQVLIEVLPNTPTYLKVNGFDSNLNVLSVTINKETAGNTEILPFRVQARGITSTDTWNLIYDIRASISRIRNPVLVVRSAGAIIQPGQIVRYSWNQTGRGEKSPKVEAEFIGRTGSATGLTQSNLTLIQAIKFRPIVLGHYLLTVTPRDVRGEPPRGSVSNGSVFRCAFGSQNLAPVPDGLAADTFFPEINQAVTLLPIAVDPETGVFEFANQSFDFGDGLTASGITGSTSHAYAQSGIYRVRCTVADDQSASAIAEDDIFVGAKTPSEFSFRVFKTIPPLEAGVGELGVDTLTATFKGITAKAGDRLVFVYNRNRFGRNSESDPSDDTDIILKTNSFSGSTRLARTVVMTASANSITVQISKASLDSTGDPRFGRADLKGVFKNQRIGICVYPADGSTPSVFVYTGNIQVKVKGGEVGRFNFVPEESLTGVNTTKEPDPKKQDAQ